MTAEEKKIAQSPGREVRKLHDPDSPFGVILVVHGGDHEEAKRIGFTLASMRELDKGN